MKKNSTILFKLLLVFIPFFATAQRIIDTSKNPITETANIVFIYSFLEDAVINNLYIRSPFFINDTLVCRMTNNHYSVHSVAPGTHKLSVQRSGKKIGKWVLNRNVTVKAGETVYYLFYNEFSFFREDLLFESIDASKGKKILRQIFEEEKCNETITFHHPIITDKKFYVQLQMGASNYSSNPKSWKSRFGDPLISNYNPLIFGGEFATRIGIHKHYVGFEFNSSRQSPVTPISSFPTGERRWININQMGILYRYFIQLDKKNKLVIAPKFGIGLINVEEKTNNPSISDRTIDANSGFAFSLGIQPEYRFSKNFSALLNSDYVTGTINPGGRDKLTLNQFRLFGGFKYQFNN